MSDRKDFYYDQLVAQAELDEAFAELEAADRAIVKDILGYGFFIGVVYTADVAENAVPDLSVLVEKFLGYDDLGRKLCNERHGYQGGVDLGAASPTQEVDLSVDENGASTNVATVGEEKIVSVFVEFHRHQADARTDGNGAAVFFDQEESVKFNVVQSASAPAGTAVPPPLRANQLLLCDVTRAQGVSTIQDADIDFSRRQAFAFSLLHGTEHAGDGADPVPDATTSVAGLMPAADKTKLDAITFTKAGIGALFDCQAAIYQPADITAPATTFLDVTSKFVGKAAGGAAGKEGIVTQSGAPNNRAMILDEDRDEILDAAGNKVYGRVTVDDETTPTVWTLTFYSFDETSGEQVFDMTPRGGATLSFFVMETYRLHNLPTFGKDFTVPSDQLAAEIPDATTTTKGKVELATDGETTAGLAVQGNDSRLLGVSVKKNSGAVVGTRRNINVIEGSNVTLTVADDGTDIDVTIAASTTPTSIQTAFAVDTNASSPSDIATGFTPKIAVVLATVLDGAGNGAMSVGLATGTGSSQACACVVGGGGGTVSDVTASRIIDSGPSATATWNVSQFDSTRVRLSANLSTTPPDIVALVLGTN